jgi:PAS domain S-box-containing protein
MFNSASLQTAHEDRFRRVMLASGVGMAIVDLDGRWVEVNPAFERMFGYAAGELVGRAAAELAHPEDLDAAHAAFARALEGAPARETQQRYLHRNGEVVWAQANVAVMQDDAGQPSYLIVHLRDVSDARAAGQALQARNDTLEAQLQAMSQQQEAFAYGISHDLRAPLRAIDSFAGLLDARVHASLDDTGRDYLERIRAAAGRMGGLIDALLHLSRVNRIEYRREPVDISLLAEWAGAELQDAEPGRAADIEVTPGLLVMGDERQLKLMLTQLLDNAWKFSRDRERVRIEVHGERAGDVMRIRIRDHGAGFDMCYADKLFTPFQRLHGPGEGGGDGLGLAIAHGIVARHGGRITAESQPGRGSTFHLELPAVTESAPPSERTEPPP